jgi:hypothetical protein
MGRGGEWRERRKTRETRERGKTREKFFQGVPLVHGHVP